MSARLLGSGCASATDAPASANNATTATTLARPIIRLVSLPDLIWAPFMANQGSPNDLLFPYVFLPRLTGRRFWPRRGQNAMVADPRVFTRALPEGEGNPAALSHAKIMICNHPTPRAQLSPSSILPLRRVGVLAAPRPKAPWKL